MVFRSPLLCVNIALCLLSLHNADAFNWPKAKPRLTAFSWNDCGPATDPAQVKSLSVGPDPLKIPGNVTVSTSFTLTAGSSTDLGLSVTMEKKVAGFWIKIPCIDNVGSCTYGDICKTWADICPTYFAKYGLPCTCPFPAQSYTVTDLVYDITQKLPGIASGEFRLTGNLVSATAGHIVCVQLDINLST